MRNFLSFYQKLCFVNEKDLHFFYNIQGKVTNLDGGHFFLIFL